MLNQDYDLANTVTLITREQIGETGINIDMLLGYAHSLAAAIKRHVEEGGNAGTHAYDLLAQNAAVEAQNTETLIEMVAATVLASLIDEEGGGRSNITISPERMDSMHKRYEMIVNRDGMQTTISIKPRKAFAGSLRVEGAGYEMPAKPQALAAKPEPHWFAKIDGERLHCADRKSAENAVRLSLGAEPNKDAHVENRRCPRADCPAPAHVDTCMATFCPSK